MHLRDMSYFCIPVCYSFQSFHLWLMTLAREEHDTLKPWRKVMTNTHAPIVNEQHEN
jgi:hypothetical protein